MSAAVIVAYLTLGGRAEDRRDDGVPGAARRSSPISGDAMIAWEDHSHGADQAVSLSAVMLGQPLRSAGCLQDRRDLERRLEPRAEELRFDV